MSVKTPELYHEKLIELNNQFNLVLGEFVKMYPTFKINPEYEEYAKAFETDRGNLEGNQRNFFLFQNNLEKDMETLSQQISQIDKQIEFLKKENKKLQKTADSLTSGDNAAKGLSKEYQFLYNVQLLSTIGLGLGATIVGALSYMKYKK